MRIAALRAVIEERLDGLEEDVGKLAHMPSVWDLTMAALETRRIGGIAAVRRRTGVPLVAVFDPRLLSEKSLAKETDLLAVMQGSARFRGGKRALTRRKKVRE